MARHDSQKQTLSHGMVQTAQTTCKSSLLLADKRKTGRILHPSILKPSLLLQMCTSAIHEKKRMLCLKSRNVHVITTLHSTCLNPGVRTRHGELLLYLWTEDKKCYDRYVRLGFVGLS